jgi:hypothetical protein
MWHYVQSTLHCLILFIRIPCYHCPLILLPSDRFLSFFSVKAVKLFLVSSIRQTQLVLAFLTWLPEPEVYEYYVSRKNDQVSCYIIFSITHFMSCRSRHFYSYSWLSDRCEWGKWVLFISLRIYFMLIVRLVFPRQQSRNNTWKVLCPSRRRSGTLRNWCHKCCVSLTR